MKTSKNIASGIVTKSVLCHLTLMGCLSLDGWQLSKQTANLFKQILNTLTINELQKVLPDREMFIAKDAPARETYCTAPFRFHVNVVGIVNDKTVTK